MLAVSFLIVLRLRPVVFDILLLLERLIIEFLFRQSRNADTFNRLFFVLAPVLSPLVNVQIRLLNQGIRMLVVFKEVEIIQFGVLYFLCLN